jgi:hypothetical protein
VGQIGLRTELVAASLAFGTRRTLVNRADDAYVSTSELALTLQLERDSQSAFLRALALLHRRRCRVTRADFRSHASRCDVLELTIQAPPRHAHRVGAWLSALVDVHGVCATAPGPSDATGEDDQRLGAEDLRAAWPTAADTVDHAPEVVDVGHPDADQGVGVACKRERLD